VTIYPDPTEEGVLLSECIEEIHRLKSRNEKLENALDHSRSWLKTADDYSNRRDMNDPTTGRDREWYKLKYLAEREAFRRALKELECV